MKREFNGARDFPVCALIRVRHCLCVDMFVGKVLVLDVHSAFNCQLVMKEKFPAYQV
jgi:hypothetical protein